MATLLVADDSVTVQRVVELTFKGEDLRVVAVGDGDEALRRIESDDPPDIVLADTAMPGRSGYELGAYIKHASTLAHIPVILLAGTFEPIDGARADEVSDATLTKPFEPQQLVRLVRRLLAGERGIRAPEGTPGQQTNRSPGSDGDSADATNAGRQGSSADYFERLDAALSALQGAPASERPARSVADEISGVASRTSQAPPATAAQLPASYASPPPASLADAFSVLLEAEQTGVVPQFPPAQAAGPQEISAALMDEIVRRVLAQLSDRVIRETVVETVQAIAERIIREEIERLKASIR